MFSKIGWPRRHTVGMAFAASMVVAGCDDGRIDNVAEVNAVAAAPQLKPVPTAPITIPALDRESLLLAVVQATSAAAAGLDDSEAQAELGGRQFTFRMRSGCNGAPANEAAGPMTWTYDSENQTLRAVAAPDIDLASPLIKAMAGPEVEAIQGFWVRQPWLLAKSCPVMTGASPENPQPEVGLAQFFTAEESRVERRSRPFQTVQKLVPDSAPGEEGLDLVLSGRLKQLPDGRVIKCVPTGFNRRPACVVSVEYNRVAVENPATGAIIAEWGVG